MVCNTYKWDSHDMDIDVTYQYEACDWSSVKIQKFENGGDPLYHVFNLVFL